MDSKFVMTFTPFVVSKSSVSASACAWAGLPRACVSISACIAARTDRTPAEQGNIGARTKAEERHLAAMVAEAGFLALLCLSAVRATPRLGRGPGHRPVERHWLYRCAAAMRR